MTPSSDRQSTTDSAAAFRLSFRPAVPLDSQTRYEAECQAEHRANIDKDMRKAGLDPFLWSCLKLDSTWPVVADAVTDDTTSDPIDDVLAAAYRVFGLLALALLATLAMVGGQTR